MVIKVGGLVPSYLRLCICVLCVLWYMSCRVMDMRNKVSERQNEKILLKMNKYVFVIIREKTCF